MYKEAIVFLWVFRYNRDVSLYIWFFKLNYSSGRCGTVAAKQKPSLKPTTPLKGSIHWFDISNVFLNLALSEVPNLRATIVAALCRERHSGAFPQILPSLLQGFAQFECSWSLKRLWKYDFKKSSIAGSPLEMQRLRKEHDSATQQSSSSFFYSSSSQLLLWWSLAQ